LAENLPYSPAKLRATNGANHLLHCHFTSLGWLKSPFVTRLRKGLQVIIPSWLKKTWIL
jgi:hypothetical protein